MIQLTFKPSGAAPRSVEVPAGPSFQRMGIGLPDIQVVKRGGSTALLVRNGYMRATNRAEQYGTLRGRLTITNGGAKIVDEDVTITDGTSLCYTQVESISPVIPGTVVDWLLRDAKGFSKPTREALAHYFAGCNPYYGGKPGVRQGEPDAPGSKEMTEYAWRGALGAAFLTRSGITVPNAYRAAAADRTRTAFWTPCGYYDDKGEPYRFSAEPDTLVDEKGLSTVGYGSVDRPSESPYQLADIEHFTIDGEWADAVLYNSPAAWLILDHMGEALCSRSLCRSPAPSLDPLRGRARTIKALGQLVGIYGDTRPQFKLALANVYAGMVAGFGTSPDGIPYAGVGPVKAVSATFTHVCVSPTEAAGLTSTALKQLQEDMRGVTVEWLGAALTALNIVRDIPAAAACCPNLALSVSHLMACFANARHVGIDNDGQPAIAAPFQDSYAWRVFGRVHRPNLAWKGTMDWCAQAVTPAEMAKMPDSKIGTATAVECFWPMLGLAT